MKNAFRRAAATATLALLASAAPAWAAGEGIPSCYAANPKAELPVPTPQLELFVLVDQTTPLDASLQASVREQVGRLVQPGAAFTVASFSSYGQGRYLEVLAGGALEVAIPDDKRNSIGTKVLREFDACLKGQLNYGRNLAATGLNKALGGLSTEYAKSDVMGSVRELAQRIRESRAQEKVLFLVSDMLENSGITSFYANKNVRKLDVAAELKKAEAANMLADLGGARVYVLGAGLVQAPGGKGAPAKDSGVYRDPVIMEGLRGFWESYIQRSNGKLQAFGAPALVVPVR